MARIGDYLHWLLPAEGGNEDKCPSWPPDVFAVAAILVEASECYTNQRYVTPSCTGYFFNQNYLNQVKSVAKIWRGKVKDQPIEQRAKEYPPVEVQDQWSKLVSFSNTELLDETSQGVEWQNCAIWLLAVADEASAGFGFHGKDNLTYDEDNLSAVFVKHYLRSERGEPTDLCLPHSICRSVPPDRACVQPKTNTPQAGCTLRSLSHHLALLPPMGVVRTRWSLAEPQEPFSYEQINILLVPFPYQIEEKSFCSLSASIWAESDPLAHGYFELRQEWLRDCSRQDFTSSNCLRELGEFVVSLVESARKEVGRVHGLVIPESALERKLSDEIARLLAKHTQLQWLVCGVSDKFDDQDQISSNWAQFYRFHQGTIFYNRRQRKHHRWFLNESQIRQYSLGRVLKPQDRTWWECIALQPRECNFYVVQGGASIAAIVCEDLARHDPVMPVLRSIGPNLLIALLLDGPQLKERWPSRYATVLADDPGCSVLTLTSLGMVKRSDAPRSGERREIALWKQPGGQSEELKLPTGDHGLVLTLNVKGTTQLTLDRRSDNNMTPHLTLADARGIRIRDKVIPRWLNLD